MPNVLFVTDDRDLREAAARALSAVGYTVRTAGHAGHAVLACLGPDHVDVLVTEVSMPDMSGPALAERLRRHRHDLPVVYMGQPGTPASQGVLVRPFTRDALVRELECAITAARAF